MYERNERHFTWIRIQGRESLSRGFFDDPRGPDDASAGCCQVIAEANWRRSSGCPPIGRRESRPAHRRTYFRRPAGCVSGLRTLHIAITVRIRTRETFIYDNETEQCVAHVVHHCGGEFSANATWKRKGGRQVADRRQAAAGERLQPLGVRSRTVGSQGVRAEVVRRHDAVEFRPRGRALSSGPVYSRAATSGLTQ
jgi:hypothetical protein